ncbi:ribonuclease P protein subunit p30 [Osmia bicornis bicornis]|uniref:ribonuclease P protein subunit p30 n=1 Tax=Osmia bicornis bicornis TaxID=1437191 RepID=UPI0010F50B66|nr:ribonuclease P protein subunit p30 [Osmia bicornis bicornis]
MDIRQSTGFYDLCVNVQENNVQNLHCILSKLYEYGFRTVALNTNLDESVLVTDRKKKKKNDEGEASQNTIPETVDIESIRKEFDGKLKVFNRITFLCADPAKTHILNHCPALKKYDLYAFAPKSQNALQFACTQLNADLITLRPSFVTMKLNKKLYEQAIERGIHFEIQYADLLNVQSRKLAIHYSHLFHTYGKSKNVILSSGCNNIRTIRNPYDLINLSCLLGLNEVKAKASVLHQCRKLLLKAERRRRGKAAFIIEEQEETNGDTNEDNIRISKRLKL